MIRSATDCTRPAESPLLIFDQRIGLILYPTIRGKGDILAQLRKEVKKADKVYLATDPDREGEAISWHLYYALKLENKKCSRITFNEITKDAVKKSIKNSRDIDMNLVNEVQSYHFYLQQNEPPEFFSLLALKCLQ